MKLTSREKKYMMIALTVVFCSMVLSHLIIPQREKYLATKLAIVQSQNQLSQLKTVNSSARDSESQVKKMTVQMSVYTKQLPVRPETAELLYYLNVAAQTTGVELELYEKSGLESERNQGNQDQNGNGSGKKANTNNKNGIVTIPLRIRVMGNYKQIRAFLGETEHLRRITHNKSLVINDIPELKKLECIVGFDAFYKADEIFVTENNDVPSASTGKQTLFKY